MLSDSELMKNHSDCLKLLDVFLSICDANNIEYFIAEGSALGTVREKGFIPWDVNIDINMSIIEYEKLDKILSSMDLGDMIWELPKHGRMAKWLVFKNPGDCRVRSNLDIGLFAPCSSFLIARLFEHLFLLWNYKAHKLKHSTIKRSFPYNILARISKLFSENFYFGNMNRFAHKKKLNNAKYVANITPGGLLLKGHVLPVDVYYGDRAYGEFEGRRVRLPSRWDYYLRGMYGDDYMTPKRVEKGTYFHQKK